MSPEPPPAAAFDELTSPQVRESVSACRTLVWPIGATEQHGPHLPLSVDSILAEEFARQIAADLGGLTLPVQPVAARSLPQSGGGLSFPGTLYVRGDTLVRFLRDAFASLLTLPFLRLVVVNGHYENEPFVFEALDQLRQDGAADGKEIFAFSWWSVVQESWLTAEFPSFPGWHAEHAGLTETSLMLYLRPDLVRDDRPGHDHPPRNGVYLHPIDTERTTNHGILSPTSGSSAALGEKLFRHVTEEAVGLIRDGDGLLFARTRPDRRAAAAESGGKTHDA
ncbi:amidohydrolase [Streptosporangium nondiastaticum]|uniref:Amidohydrolase n=1 Tax=Streptosporangium nondiastaticum TaxID=35764 RepID=A0A9X7JN83_9ACTN|nr:creatininase family protein [Streptosporangium nondiastaticum]PSJ26808.1 amidohydrolase [Streptosporangium nondiastaticum]